MTRRRSWMAAAATAAMLVTAVSSAKTPRRGTAAEVRADFDVMCNVVERSGAGSVADQREKVQKIVRYLVDHIRTEEATRFMQSLAAYPPAEKSTRLKKAAKDAGYTGACPFADEK